MADLKKGSKGREVKELQTKLNNQKKSPKLKVDGVFGPVTEKALEEYQKSNKLKVSGVFDKKTAEVSNEQNEKIKDKLDLPNTSSRAATAPKV
jgi:peptidoglycan hydrolase-like protein with peptidoglycan-binding domain